jgi:hypothetical protein
MKRTVFVLSTVLVVFVAVFAVLLLRPVRKVRAHEGCSEASLDGNYRLVMTGSFEWWGYQWYSTADFPAPWDFSMLATFDGKGNLSGSNLMGAYASWVYDNGSPGTGPLSFTGGTYTVNHDCTVTMTIPAGLDVFWGYPVNLNGILIDTGGDEAVGTGHNSGGHDYGWTGTFDAKRVGQGKWNFFD